jgi:hypothetical protein
MSASTADRLRLVKLLHTVVWVFFVAAIMAVWVFSWQRNFTGALWMIALVGVEVMVLLLNDWHCPLTPLAASFSDPNESNEPRRANFDIYLPEWLARRNKLVFGFLYGAGVAFSTYTWLVEGSKNAR